MPTTIVERPPSFISRTATAASQDAQDLLHFRRTFNATAKPLYDNAPHHDVELLIEVQADFPRPMSIADIARQHQSFVASFGRALCDVDVIDDDA